MFISNKRALSAVFLILAAGGQAQDRALDLASKLASTGQYEDAITEYKRYIFFNGENPNADVSYAYERLGLAFGATGRWPEAAKALSQSIQTATDEKTRDERRLSLAIIQISAKNYDAAQFLLLKLEMFAADEEVKKKAQFLRGVCSLYVFDWTNAKSAFEDYSRNPQSRESLAEGLAIQALCDEALRAKRKSSALAKWLSTFVPGSGQLYCGDWLDGLNALALNVATGWLLVDDLRDKRYQDVLFNSLFLFKRFYQGNRSNAERVARQFNDRLDRDWAEKIMTVLQEKKN